MTAVTAFGRERFGAQIGHFYPVCIFKNSYGIILILESVLKERCTNYRLTIKHSTKDLSVYNIF